MVILTYQNLLEVKTDLFLPDFAGNLSIVS
jgi:hypothetical protein